MFKKSLFWPKLNLEAYIHLIVKENRCLAKMHSNQECKKIQNSWPTLFRSNEGRYPVLAEIQKYILQAPKD